MVVVGEVVVVVVDVVLDVEVVVLVVVVGRVELSLDSCGGKLEY